MARSEDIAKHTMEIIKREHSIGLGWNYLIEFILAAINTYKVSQELAIPFIRARCRSVAATLIVARHR